MRTGVLRVGPGGQGGRSKNVKHLPTPGYGQLPIDVNSQRKELKQGNKLMPSILQDVNNKRKPEGEAQCCV